MVFNESYLFQGIGQKKAFVLSAVMSVNFLQRIKTSIPIDHSFKDNDICISTISADHLIGMFDIMMAMLPGWCNTCLSCIFNFFSTQIYVAHRSAVSGSSTVHACYVWESGFPVPNHDCHNSIVLHKPSLASIGCAMLMRPNHSKTAVHGCLIPARVTIYMCPCI